MEASKTEKAVQILAKIGYIISKIVKIVCLVAGIVSVVGLICLCALPSTGLVLGKFVFHQLIETEIGGNLPVTIAMTIAAIIVCAAEFYLARTAEKYFKNELAAGSPFTMEGSKEMLHLGIKAIVAPIVCAIACNAIVAGTALLNHAAIPNDIPDISGTIGIGIMFIFVSLICKLGAEKIGQKQA